MAYGAKKLQRLSRELFPEDAVAATHDHDNSAYEDKVQAICARYVYYKQQRLPNLVTYDQILKKLEREFWLSSKQITNIICSNPKKVEEAKEKKKEWFRINWAHLVW